MKILIVEDEYFIRKAIVKMLNDRNTNDICILEAQNGKYAIEVIKNELPDIVFSDIRMPEMDGIELIKYIHENFEHIATIIISGFPDFQYAQSAMRYGAKDYLLKPVKKKQFLELVDTLYEEYQKKEKIKNYLAEQKLNDLIEGKNFTHIDSFRNLLHLDKEPAGFRVAVIQKSGNFDSTEKVEINCIIQDKQKGLHIFFTKAQEAVVIMISRTLRGSNEEVYDKQLSNLRKLIYTRKELNLVIGISGECNTFEVMPKAYIQARKAITIHLLEGRGRIYEFDGIKKHWKPYSLVFSNELRVFNYALLEINERACKNIVNMMVDEAVKLREGALAALEELCNQFVFSINRALKEYLKTKESKEYVEYKVIDLSWMNSTEEMKRHIFAAVQGYCETVLGDGTDEEETVAKIQKYIEVHFYEDISLDKIAEKICYMNASYLSRLFKARTGITFSSALKNIRMQKAARLLEDNTVSISEIASLVGYNDVSYFVQFFKKYYGCTPKAYQQKEYERKKLSVEIRKEKQEYSG